MGTGNLISLILLGLVFLAWAASMFQMLGVIWRAAEARTAEEPGGLFTGTANRWRAYWAFFRDPGQRRLKVRILVLTGLLVILILARSAGSLQVQ